MVSVDELQVLLEQLGGHRGIHLGPAGVVEGQVGLVVVLVDELQGLLEQLGGHALNGIHLGGHRVSL